ncbi:MAG: NUDIX domain-containing protein [Candidatus Peribacteria bacterium]|jgi:8-oxo-dGTP pyrophosphatase MutT (NUDIX family)|nr:NUDIX domain-containing protein [Candidatus Peribacteria bacterium]
MRTVVNGISINPSKEILLVKKKNIRILPGGKIEVDQQGKEIEIDTQALQREIFEELSKLVINTDTAKHYKDFTGITPHSKQPVTTRTYFIDIPEGKNIIPSAEIKEAKYFRMDEIYILCSDITKNILTTLRQDNLL